MAVDRLPTLRQQLGLGRIQEPNEELPTALVEHRVIEALRQLFQTRKDRFRWKKDLKGLDGILIADVYALHLDSVEQKPAIIVRRGGTTWLHQGIGQYGGAWPNTGGRWGIDLLRSNVTCNCVARAGMEAKYLADLVSSGFTYFRHQIRTAPNLVDVRTIGPGQETLVRSDSEVELSLVPVSMEVYFQQQWVVRPNDKSELAEIRTNINFD